MSRIKISRDLREQTQVVAAVHSPRALICAQKIKPGEVDLLEIRVDNFSANPEPLLAALPKLRVPLLVTVRHPAEGGANDLTFARRRELYGLFLPHAALIDVELRSLEKLTDVVASARRSGVKIIASSHYFRSTPSSAILQQAIRQAHSAGADVCKLAALAETPASLGRLLALLGRRQPLPLSVMGMGKFGKISRLLLAQAGSVLNYGYLDRPNASGQWEARLLKSRLAELTAS
jgi:3-dehydroquinate dehydratase-1